MLFSYAFMTVIYFALWFAILFFTVYVLPEIPLIGRLTRVSNIISIAYRKLAIIPFIFALGVYTYPILLTTLFNYSQYLYYGENFIFTMSNEFNNRDTGTYLEVIRNSINQKFHTILDFF